MPYYLGIDGGGTKTTCAVGDERQLLATATTGASNIVRVGEPQARESLVQAVRQACAAAGIAPAQVERTCVGGSGAARPEMSAAVRRILEAILSTPIDVAGDMEIALEAAVGEGPGVVVIAGTGSIAFGRNARGETARVGGWGFAVGDEGSAHWIGREAVRAVLQAADERDGSADARAAFERSAFVAGLMKRWGVGTLADLARAGNAIPPPDFAALFPAVACGEDPLAGEVLTSAGQELARLAAVVMRRLFAAETGLVPVAMTGGVFRHAPRVREIFYNELRARDARAEVIPQVVEPVEGALRRARRGQGRSG